MLLEQRLSALLQLHLHSQLHIWLQGIRLRQPLDSTRILEVLGFGTSYIRDLTVNLVIHGWGISSDITLRCLSLDLTYFWSVNIGSGNGLVPSGTKPLPEPILTHDPVICHHMASTRPQWFNLSTLWSPTKIVDFLPTTFKLILLNKFGFLSNWSLFLRAHLTICQHWFRWWFDPKQATRHHLH